MNDYEPDFGDYDGSQTEDYNNDGVEDMDLEQREPPNREPIYPDYGSSELGEDNV